MKKMKFGRSGVKVALATFASAALVCGLLAGCSSQSVNQSSNDQQSSQSASQTVSLEGQQLDIYCGAGMTAPFTEITDLFTEQTGCEMNVTYANAAQIQTQIQTTGEGDMFIAGSKEEVKPVEDSVTKSIDLVKHIPVLAVPSANPKQINSIADLANAKVVIVGDPESTPIGKIAKKVLGDAGLWEELMSAGVITTTTTAPQIGTALANGEGDAGIVWKENATNDGITILDSPEMAAQVKVIPCAVLKSVADEDAAAAFEAFLQTDEVWNIWASYGYERA